MLSVIDKANATPQLILDFLLDYTSREDMIQEQNLDILPADSKKEPHLSISIQVKNPSLCVPNPKKGTTSEHIKLRNKIPHYSVPNPKK